MNLDRLTVDVIGRKDEAERLKHILKGTEQGYLPKVISVFGPPGSGKTLVTRKVCSDYERDSGGVFKFIYANIGEVRTVFSVANRFLMALGREPKLSRTGLDGAMKEFWEALRELSNSGTKFILVGLDEADRLFFDRRGDPSGFMYMLVRSEDRLSESGIRLSVMTISNLIAWDYWELDGRVRSSMGTEDIFFSPYEKENLKKILVSRYEEAFSPGAVEEQVIQDCVDYTFGQSRDIRRMVDLLRISAEIAEAEGSKKVESKHFDRALDRVEADYLETLLERLPANQIIILFIMAKFKEHEDQDIMNTGLIHKGLQEIVGHDKVLSYRRISGILKELEVMGLIGGRTTSKSGGGYGREIWLKVPVDKILDYTERKWKKQNADS